MGEVRTVAVSLVLAACAVGWLVVVPLLLLQGILVSTPVFGTSGDASGPFTQAAVLGVGLPVVGVVVAAVTRRVGWTWFFGVCLLVVAAVATLKWADEARHAPPPPPEPTHCVERSGGGNECPGG